MRRFLRMIWWTIPKRKRPEFWWFRDQMRKEKYKIVFPRRGKKVLVFRHGKYKILKREKAA